MGLAQRLASCPAILMEGALSERLKREYCLTFDGRVALAGLVTTEVGRDALAALWREYIDIARIYRLPFLATTPTRRANRERVAASRYDESILAENAAFLCSLRDQSRHEMYAGGLMGCKGDAYTGEGALSAGEARSFHAWQAGRLARAGLDFLYAGIMPTLPEALGMAQAMGDTGLPYLISFTLRPDGRLIDGTRLCDAIEQIDAAADPRPLCYLTNCIHPDRLYEALCQPFNRTAAVKERFWGIQANGSPLSFDELDGCAELQCSEPDRWAASMLRLRDEMGLKLFGGCCGTDARHLAAIAQRIAKQP
ncbi:homocysteine S-methyltransferase family protein [Ligaoa zhengdingensis]|uniref:homocysteine S-methyltransferase family protein n=2 Tax=Ligaoa zhengdingensis TaxID=2763658 RepID=UPI0031BA10EE